MTLESQPQQPDGMERAALGRRMFLQRAAIGAGAVGAIALLPALASRSGGGAAPETAAAIDEPQGTGPLVVYVRDAARGEAVIMDGSSETMVVDRALVSALLRAQGKLT